MTSGEPGRARGPLEGLRVLDFGRFIAGPYCATLLGDYGAEVIRIEKRDGSEDRHATPVSDGGDGALFLQVARNKRSLSLDPASAEGREIVRRLLRTADVVIANLPADALASLGLDWASVSAIRPEIVLVTASAFGAEGPYAGYVGYDGVAQAMSGAVYMTGEPQQPYRAQVPWVDFGTALHCAFGVMLALRERERTGRGQHVEGALLATALTFTNAMLIEQAVRVPDRRPTGNRGQTSGPTDVFRTRDGWLLTQVVGTPLFRRWARLMGEPQWLEDPRFATDETRGAHGELLSERMARWCAERTTDEAIAELGRARIPCGPVLSPQQALDHPQTRAMRLLHPVASADLPRPAPVAGVPLRMSACEPRPPARAAAVGAHTAEILHELGFDDAAIEGLRAHAVI